MTVLCFNCIHYTGGSATEDYLTCHAFPGGIPEVIISGHWDHRLAYPGDNGILYDGIDDLKLDPPEPYEPPPPGLQDMP